jgi:hypothetical protein
MGRPAALPGAGSLLQANLLSVYFYRQGWQNGNPGGYLSAVMVHRSSGFHPQDAGRCL